MRDRAALILLDGKGMSSYLGGETRGFPMSRANHAKRHRRVVAMAESPCFHVTFFPSASVRPS